MKLLFKTMTKGINTQAGVRNCADENDVTHPSLVFKTAKLKSVWTAH